MFGMLQIAFGKNVVPACLRITGKLGIFFNDVLGRAANFNIGAIRLIPTMEWIAAPPAAAFTATISSTHTLSWSQSHC
jgi:hypothetical protein